MAKNKKTLQRWEAALSPEDAAAYLHYMAQIQVAIRLPAKETQRILDDFKELLRYYHAQGLPMQQAAARIGPQPLGGFYAPADAAEWYALDSAAKVYPLSMHASNMSVYRVSIYMREPVVPQALQVALLCTIKRFPIFSTTIRKGVFWHFIDATRCRFAVQEERDIPVQPLNISGVRAPSFRVQYYNRRISVEIFHILTDGTGALIFLKTLAAEYLRLLGKAPAAQPGILPVNGPVRAEELMSSFSLADAADKAEGFFLPAAAQIGGKRTLRQPARVVQLFLPVSKLRETAKRFHTTVTGLLTAAVTLAAAATIRAPKPKSRIHIQVPVNMRAYYPSETLRNFSMYCVIRLTYAQITSLSAVIPLVEAQLRAGTEKPALDRMLHMTNALVSNPLIRYTPLFLKRLAFRWGYGFIGERAYTTTLSNIGVIKNDFCGEVDCFDVILGPSGTNNASCGLVSFGEKAVCSITKSTLDSAFEDMLRRLLEEQGIPVEVEATPL